MLRPILSLTATAILVIAGCAADGSITGQDDVPLDIAEIRARVEWSDGPRFAFLAPSHGEVSWLLTEGVVTPDGSTLVGIEHRGGTTPLTTWDLGRDEQRILAGPSGAWDVVSVGVADRPTGVSLDGQTVVLEKRGATDGSGFAVVPLDDGRPPTILEFEPRFAYDAVSPDGRVLYLVETLVEANPPAYRVRAADVSSGRLRDEVIVDKRNVEVGSMSGRPIDQVAGDSGRVYTLYQGTHHAFIHALSTIEAAAVCIDLPDGGRPGLADDEAAAEAWVLRHDSTTRRLYAANGVTGTVVVIETGGHSVVASVDLGEGPESAAGDPLPGAAVITSDWRTLWVSMRDGLVALDLATLEPRGPYLVDRSVRSLARASDPGSVLALSTDGEILRLDASTGEMLTSRAPKVGPSIIELIDGSSR